MIIMDLDDPLEGGPCYQARRANPHPDPDPDPNPDLDPDPDPDD